MKLLSRIGATLASALGFREAMLLAGATLIGVGLALISPCIGVAAAGSVLAYVAVFGVK